MEGMVIMAIYCAFRHRRMRDASDSWRVPLRYIFLPNAGARLPITGHRHSRVSYRMISAPVLHRIHTQILTTFTSYGVTFLLPSSPLLIAFISSHHID